MSDFHKKIGEDLFVIYEKIDEALSEWDWSKNMQFPTLLANVAVKMGVNDISDEKEAKRQIRKLDNVIRYYIDEHPSWISKRGATGGVQPALAANKKAELKAATLLAKKALKEQIEREVSQDDDLAELSEDDE